VHVNDAGKNSRICQVLSFSCNHKNDKTVHFAAIQSD